MENVIETQRLILRGFSEKDAEKLFPFFADERTNRFLPFFPARTPGDAREIVRRFLKEDAEGIALHRAVCFAGEPVGYIHAGLGESRDLGYGLRSDFWNRGYATEAAAAVLQKSREAGFKYVTATHDRNNPQSGRVMQKAGMTYRYSYTEQWQPKDRSVVFRMYQINFDEGTFVYGRYREMYPHFIESDL